MRVCLPLAVRMEAIQAEAEVIQEVIAVLGPIAELILVLILNRTPVGTGGGRLGEDTIHQVIGAFPREDPPSEDAPTLHHGLRAHHLELEEKNREDTPRDRTTCLGVPLKMILLVVHTWHAATRTYAHSKMILVIVIALHLVATVHRHGIPRLLAVLVLTALPIDARRRHGTILLIADTVGHLPVEHLLAKTKIARILHRHGIVMIHLDVEMRITRTQISGAGVLVSIEEIESDRRCINIVIVHSKVAIYQNRSYANTPGVFSINEWARSQNFV